MGSGYAGTVTAVIETHALHIIASIVLQPSDLVFTALFFTYRAYAWLQRGVENL